MAEDALDRDIAAFEAMKDELERHHHRKWVVFHETRLVEAFDTFDAAATAAVERFGRGPYLIRQVAAPPIRLPTSVMFRMPAGAA